MLVDHAEIDHVIPLSQGGEDADANTRITHWRCNRVRAGRVTVTSLPVGTAGDKPPPWTRRHEWKRAIPVQVPAMPSSVLEAQMRERLTRQADRIAALERENGRLASDASHAREAAHINAERLSAAEGELRRLRSRRWWEWWV